jgi:hypothetical protein
MDPITIALSHVFNNIPPEILYTAFVNEYMRKTGRVARNVDTGIINDVINSRVLLDANISSGLIKDIILRSHFLEPAVADYNNPYFTGQYTLYRIPPDARDHAFITSVININFPQYYSYTSTTIPPFGSMHPGANIRSVANQAINSHTGADVNTTPIGKAVDGEMIQITSPQYLHVDWIVTCKLAFRPDFDNLNQQAYQSFKELVLCGVKAYIYNNLIIELDRVTITGGQTTGMIRDIIASYESANEQYTEALKAFRSANALDRARLGNMLRYMLP